MQEDGDDDGEAGVFGEVDTPSPCRPEHHLVEVKKEEESDDDGDVDSLCTTPAISPGEEVKCEPEEEYPICPTPASNPQNMLPLAPSHQTNGYWPQPPNVSFSPSQPFAAHGVAGMAGLNDVPREAYTAPPADPMSYYDGGMQSAHAPSQAFSQYGDPAGTASFYAYPSRFELQQTWPHPPPAFSPYFGLNGASAAILSPAGELLCS
ncbi:hypothetical protein AAVH_09623 [Aphelenchoides avenae]|nr:hypothetical protein AAVH_09623 [Aphelenchus avenae]